MCIRLLPFLFFLAACAEPPPLPSSVTQTDYSAPYPTLIPIGPLLAAAGASAAVSPDAGLEARAAALNARAAALRGPVIDPETAETLQPSTTSPALQ